jgi:hypothetical protein
MLQSYDRHIKDCETNQSETWAIAENVRGRIGSGRWARVERALATGGDSEE